MLRIICFFVGHKEISRLDSYLGPSYCAMCRRELYSHYATSLAEAIFGNGGKAFGPTLSVEFIEDIKSSKFHELIIPAGIRVKPMEGSNGSP